MRKGKKQYLDPATASNELVEHVLSKAYVEAEEAMVKGAKLDYLVKIDDGSAAEKQRTAFHRIVESGDPEAIEWAAAKGATPNVPMDGCTTIVHWCVEQNKAGTLQKLCALKLAGSLARLDVSKRDKSGETPTQAAIRLLRVDLAHTLLKAGADHDFNEKSYAPPGPATPSPSPSQPTEDPAPDPPPSDEVPAPVATPLNQVQYAVCAGELELVDTLFCLGVSPFQRDYKGRPLLHLAVEGECWPVVDALLDKKVPIDVPSTRGETALELALQKVLRAQTGGSAAEAPAPPAKDAAEQAAAKPGKTAGRPDKKVVWRFLFCCVSQCSLYDRWPSHFSKLPLGSFLFRSISGVWLFLLVFVFQGFQCRQPRTQWSLPAAWIRPSREPPPQSTTKERTEKTENGEKRRKKDSAFREEDLMLASNT
ncbi:hypothetical protein DIPPA_10768 [Diplonema papillatum]|nr:hypothetical protein DIPPA_10768 [Diplonema papillatum]